MSCTCTLFVAFLDRLALNVCDICNGSIFYIIYSITNLQQRINASDLIYTLTH